MIRHFTRKMCQINTRDKRGLKKNRQLIIPIQVCQCGKQSLATSDQICDIRRSFLIIVAQ